MKNRKRNIVFGAVFLVIFVLAVGAFVVNLCQNPSLSETQQVSKELPKMMLNLRDVTLGDIYSDSKEIKYPGNELALINNDEITEFTDVEVKGRGNTTWDHIKKPLQIKLPTRADLLGLGKRRKWILLTGYWDDTNLRTDTAFYLEKMLEERFAYRGEFVELYVDGEYEGLYYLTRGIEVSKTAVDLRDSLGVLIELDNAFCGEAEYYAFSGNGECLSVKDAVTKDEEGLALADFTESFNALEEAVRAKDFAAISEIIDVESFAEYYLISEFTMNIDAYFTSQYFYKDGVDDKIHAGPAWDFDVAFDRWGGYTVDGEFTKTYLTEEFEDPEMQFSQKSRLFARLIQFSEFKAEVNRVFQERLSGRKNELLWHIFQQAAKIYSAAVQDTGKWEKGDYVQTVKSLLEWVKARYDYFEIEYGTKRYQNYPAYDINVIEV